MAKNDVAQAADGMCYIDGEHSYAHLWTLRRICPNKRQPRVSIMTWLQSLQNSLSLTLPSLCIGACCCLQVGKAEVPRSRFDSIGWAMLTVFQLLTTENWNNVLYSGRLWYFGQYIVCISWLA